ncbi:MAG: radical SAM protein [Deltaproteobacteria bacterium]|nr:radical SAM protein [Deltaproteobacteria bacterium]
MHPFIPSTIFVDAEVKDLPLTRRVLSRFADVPVEEIENPDTFKEPLVPTAAKKKLLITRSKGEPVKPCQGMGNYVCCNYMTVSFATNCPYECTYCILQDYLQNNPVMTLFANVDEILNSVEKTLQSDRKKTFRIGTGELADSLALDPITGLTRDLVPFSARQKNMILELKTKSDCIENLLDLDHGGKTVVAWSLNPQSFIDREEHKTASLEQRLIAARRVADAGYPVALHFDPLLALKDWSDEYIRLVRQVRQVLSPREIAWISIGSLRFTPGLAKIIRSRFPKSSLLTGELFPTEDGKVRYFREIREELYTHVKNLIDSAFAGVPNYLCMETKRVWEEVYRNIPETSGALEAHLAQQFAC